VRSPLSEVGALQAEPVMDQFQQAPLDDNRIFYATGSPSDEFHGQGVIPSTSQSLGYIGVVEGSARAVGLPPGAAGAGDIVDPFLGAAKVPADYRFLVGKLFPMMFTFLCFAAFLVPIWMIFHLGQDANVRQWIHGSQFLMVTLWLPILYLTVHLLHMARGGHPVKVAVVVCLVGSCIYFSIVSNHLVSESNSVGAALLAADCYSFAGKRDLELSLQRAESFYDECIASVAHESNTSVKAAGSQYLITDCPDYARKASELGQSDNWAYFRFLQENYWCSGWCQESKAMWTYVQTEDACSAVVGNIMLRKVRWSALQVLTYSLSIFCLTTAMILIVAPRLQKYGVSW